MPPSSGLLDCPPTIVLFKPSRTFCSLSFSTPLLTDAEKAPPWQAVVWIHPDGLNQRNPYHIHLTSLSSSHSTTTTSRKPSLQPLPQTVLIIKPASHHFAPPLLGPMIRDGQAALSCHHCASTVRSRACVSWQAGVSSGTFQP